MSFLKFFHMVKNNNDLIKLNIMRGGEVKLDQDRYSFNKHSNLLIFFVLIMIIVMVYRELAK